MKIFGCSGMENYSPVLNIKKISVRISLSNKGSKLSIEERLS
jgi:hypothetical protein